MRAESQQQQIAMQLMETNLYAVLEVVQKVVPSLHLFSNTAAIEVS